MPSGKSTGCPPLSGGLKAREVYQLPFRNVSRARVGVEVAVRLAELQAGEGGRQQAGVHPGLHPAQRVDDARIAPRQLALEQLVVVLAYRASSAAPRA